MANSTGPILHFEPRPKPAFRLSDFWAYVLPMGLFLLFIQVNSYWPQYYPINYTLRVVVVATALICLWPRYTRIRWNFWWLGIIVGVIGAVQWIGMQLLLQNHLEFFKPSPDAFDPLAHFDGSPALLVSFIAVRIAGAVLVVPVMEELFWRDFVWRTILAPNDFKLASVGEWDWKALVGVSLVFATVHGNWWATAIVWALMIGVLLAYTRSLGACIIAHAVTNLLLAMYVLKTHQWFFW